MSLDAYRRWTLVASLVGTALFGAGLVTLVETLSPTLAVALMVAGAAVVLASTLLDIQGAPPLAQRSLLLYTRPECALCEEARARLDALRSEGVAFDVWDVDITGDPALEARFGSLVPVGLLDGGEVFRLEVPEQRLREAFAARGAAPVSPGPPNP